MRVLLLEDHVIFRELFASAFDQQPNFEVVAQAGTLAAARQAIEDVGVVDLAVVDLRLPDGSGTDVIGDLRENNPDGAALVLTAGLDLAVYARAVSAGAAGVLHKSVSVDEVMDAMRRLAEGEALLSQEEAVGLLRLADRERTRDREAKKALEGLTRRERDVLEALGEGMGDKEISARLGVGTGTVRGYVTGMLQKLGVNSRLQALVFAVRHGFIRINPEKR